MRESSITRSILQALKRRGGFWFKVHGHPGQLRGLPDILGVYKGKFVALEVKTPERRKELTELQHHVLQKISEAGGVASVVTSAREALEVIRNLESS